MKLLNWVLAILATGLLWAQQPQRRPEDSNRPRPSDSVKDALPARDIAITVTVTSDQATVLEKARRDRSTTTLNKDGSITTAPIFATVEDLLVSDAINGYLNVLIRNYGAPKVTEAQKQLQDAQKKANDEAEAASRVTRKK